MLVRNVQVGLFAFDAKYRSSVSCAGVVQAHTVASIRTVLAAAQAAPSTGETRMRSFDSSEWNVPEVPSAHESLIVFGWLGSGPMVPRPSSSDAPESHDAPTVEHRGTC